MIVVAKGYYGLGGNLAVLACAIHFAKQNACELIVDWKNGFYDGDDVDVFEYLIKAPRSNPLPRALWGSLKVWPPEWQQYISKTKPHVKGLELSRSTATQVTLALNSGEASPEMVVISRDDENWHSPQMAGEMTQIMRGIQPSDRIQHSIDQFKRNNFNGSVIGVHFRHGNGEPTVVPPDFQWFRVQIDRFIEKSSSAKIFVCTDCRAVLDKFIDVYAERIIHTPKDYLANGGGGMHYGTTASERLRAAGEAFIDLMLLSECDYIVGSKSFFTSVAITRGGRFDSQNRSLWIPKFRSHTPPPSHNPVKSHEFYAKQLNGLNLSLDGLFVSQVGLNANELFYLHYPLGIFGDFLTESELVGLKERLMQLRYY